MPETLKKGSHDPEVSELQRLLTQRGYPAAIDGEFGTQTYQAVRAFQSQNLDQHGQPLVVDGKVGPLTWWSLTHPKPAVQPFSPIDYTRMPADQPGGSGVGRAVLTAAIGELKAGAGEVGGNNSGPFVEKYLKPAGLVPPQPWCASFVSWCFLQASGGIAAQMPFRYCPGGAGTPGCVPRPRMGLQTASGIPAGARRSGLLVAGTIEWLAGARGPRPPTEGRYALYHRRQPQPTDPRVLVCIQSDG